MMMMMTTTTMITNTTVVTQGDWHAAEPGHLLPGLQLPFLLLTDVECDYGDNKDDADDD